jgi:hypothetical protein
MKDIKINTDHTIYNLSNKYGELLISGTTYELTRYIINNNPTRFCYTKDYSRVLHSLQRAKTIKSKPYGYMLTKQRIDNAPK